MHCSLVKAELQESFKRVYSKCHAPSIQFIINTPTLISKTKYGMNTLRLIKQISSKTYIAEEQGLLIYYGKLAYELEEEIRKMSPHFPSTDLIILCGDCRMH